MKTVLAILSFVLLIAITANAQTEKKSPCCTETKVKTSQLDESSSTDVQSTLTKNSTLTAASHSGDDDGKKCEGKDKEECEKKCETKETKEIEETPQTDETSEQE